MLLSAFLGHQFTRNLLRFTSSDTGVTAAWYVMLLFIALGLCASFLKRLDGVIRIIIGLCAFLFFAASMARSVSDSQRLFDVGSWLYKFFSPCYLVALLLGSIWLISSGLSQFRLNTHVEN